MILAYFCSHKFIGRGVITVYQDRPHNPKLFIIKGIASELDLRIPLIRLNFHTD